MAPEKEVSPKRDKHPNRGIPRLNVWQYLAYGGGDMANNVAFFMAMMFLTLYLTDVALLTPAFIGGMFLVMRFIDAFTDVVMGMIIDRTDTRWGKFRPWILFGSVPLVVIAILNFAMPWSLHGTSGAMIYAAVAYFFMGSIAYTAVNIPYGSLAAAMTDRSEERSKLALFRTIGGSLMGVILALAIAPSVNKYAGQPDSLQSAILKALIPLGFVAVALYVFLFLVARENVPRSVDRVSVKESIRVIASNRPLQALSLLTFVPLTGAFAQAGLMVCYACDVFGNATVLAVVSPIGTVMIILFGWMIPGLIKKVGKVQLFIISALVGVCGNLVYFLAPTGALWALIVAAVLQGLGAGFGGTIIWNLEADTVEYGEWKTGLRSEGTTYAVFSFVRKMGQALGGAAGLWIIGWFGYQGAATVQTDSALTGIRIAVGVLPAVMSLIAIVLMIFYPMNDKQHKQIIEEIAARKAAEAPGEERVEAEGEQADKHEAKVLQESLERAEEDSAEF